MDLSFESEVGIGVGIHEIKLVCGHGTRVCFEMLVVVSKISKVKFVPIVPLYKNIVDMSYLLMHLCKERISR